MEEAIETCRSANSSEHVLVKHIRPSFFGSVSILMRRMFLNLSRDANAIQLRIFQYVALGLLLWIFIGRIGLDQTGVQNRLGYLYQATVGCLFVGILSGIALFPDMRDVYYRESRDGLYSASAFILSYTLHALPTDLLCTALFCAWTVGLIGFQGETSFLISFYAFGCGVNLGESLAIIFLLIFRSTVEKFVYLWTGYPSSWSSLNL
jgi:ABC-type multidrug transport system permease subunit